MIILIKVSPFCSLFRGPGSHNSNDIHWLRYTLSSRQCSPASSPQHLSRRQSARGVCAPRDLLKAKGLRGFPFILAGPIFVGSGVSQGESRTGRHSPGTSTPRRCGYGALRPTLTARTKQHVKRGCIAINQACSKSGLWI